MSDCDGGPTKKMFIKAFSSLDYLCVDHYDGMVLVGLHDDFDIFA